MLLQLRLRLRAASKSCQLVVLVQRPRIGRSREGRRLRRLRRRGSTALPPDPINPRVSHTRPGAPAQARACARTRVCVPLGVASSLGTRKKCVKLLLQSVQVTLHLCHILVYLLLSIANLVLNAAR